MDLGTAGLRRFSMSTATALWPDKEKKMGGTHEMRTKSRGSRARKVVALLAMAASVAIGSGLNAAPASAHHANEFATFHEDRNFSWNWLDVNAGEGIADLRSRNRCWYCGNWNDRISSVTTRGSAALLFEHINYQGSVVCVQPHSQRNLGDVGFDDQASSVSVLWAPTWGYDSSRGCPSTYEGRSVTILG